MSSWNFMFWRSNCSCLTSFRGVDIWENGLFLFFGGRAQLVTSFRGAVIQENGLFWCISQLHRCIFNLLQLQTFYLFVLFHLLYTYIYINRSVQNTFKFQHFILTALVLSCWDKFPMTIFWKLRWSRTIFKNEQCEHMYLRCQFW